MCGIVGYIGTREAYPILIEGLQSLEYRGYDSAGIALIDKGVMSVYKNKGKVAGLKALVDKKTRKGTIGIAHTRWPPMECRRRQTRIRIPTRTIKSPWCTTG